MTKRGCVVVVPHLGLGVASGRAGHDSTTTTTTGTRVGARVGAGKHGRVWIRSELGDPSRSDLCSAAVEENNKGRKENMFHGSASTNLSSSPLRSSPLPPHLQINKAGPGAPGHEPGRPRPRGRAPAPGLWAPVPGPGLLIATRRPTPYISTGAVLLIVQ